MTLATFRLLVCGIVVLTAGHAAHAGEHPASDRPFAADVAMGSDGVRPRTPLLPPSGDLLTPGGAAGGATVQAPRLISRLRWDRPLPPRSISAGAQSSSPREVPKALQWAGFGLMAAGGAMYVWGSVQGETSELRQQGAMVAGTGVVLITIGVSIRDRHP